MARNSNQLRQAIEKEVEIMRGATSQQTRQYARERFHYLQGELMLQKAYEVREGEQRTMRKCTMCTKLIPAIYKWCDYCGSPTSVR